MIITDDEILAQDQSLKQLELQEKEPLPIIYPNPFDNDIFINSPESDEIEINSMEGLVLLSLKIEQGTQKIDLDRLANGVYFLSFRNQNIIFKIVRR